MQKCTILDIFGPLEITFLGTAAPSNLAKRLSKQWETTYIKIDF